ncbi:MAG: Lipase-like protein, partial [Myxococcaceae bacterium]|nr:Lipase-like protein [Myxococcaceae bacterium]
MKKLAVAIACLSWLGCTPDIANVPPPNLIVARFDPSAVPAVVPSPNDLATNPATGLLAVPVPANATAADKEFYKYLNTLDGFPLSSGASTTFDAELKASTVGPSSVKVFDVTDGLSEVTPSGIANVQTGDAAAPGKIAIAPPSGGWKPGHTYGIAVIGGNSGVKGGDDRKVVGSATWAFIRSEGSLLECHGDGGTHCTTATELIPSPIKDDAAKRLADQTASAKRLEALRLKYKPLIDKVVATSQVPRTDVVIAWTFKATSFTQMQFNPSAMPPKVPTPNDLAIDRTTGLVNAPVDPLSSAAQQEFTKDYLNTLNGFPVSATGTAEVISGDLDPASITDKTVFVVPLVPAADGGLAELPEPPTVSYDPVTKTLKIAPPNGTWGKSQSLALVVVGGKAGVKRVGGGTVVGTEYWALARSASSLVTCTDLTSAECKPAITAAPLSTAQAVGLEAVRRGLKPVLDLLDDELGVPREVVALMWVFRTVNQPEATFDPAAAIIPFPNNLLTVPLADGGTKVNLPVPTTAGTQQQLIMGLNTLDGFSLTAMAVSENSDVRGAIDLDQIDPLSMDGGTTGFAKLAATGALQPVVAACLGCGSSKLADGGTGVFFPDGGAITPAPQQLQFIPQRPLEEKTNYAAWLTTGLRDTKGRRVMAAPAFALMRSKASLVDAGKSTISGVSDAQAAALEPARAALKPMFDALEAKGLLRKDLALAFSYRTQSTVSVLQALNAIPGLLPGATAQPSSVNNITALLPPAVIAMMPNVSKVFQAQV